jgi:hypothetical protein
LANFAHDRGDFVTRCDRRVEPDRFEHAAHTPLGTVGKIRAEAENDENSDTGHRDADEALHD